MPQVQHVGEYDHILSSPSVNNTQIESSMEKIDSKIYINEE